MRRGLPLFTFRGIKVLVHWTFLLLPAYIVITGLMEGASWGTVGMEVGLLLIVFGCVVLHEFGHALTAARFGVGTRDITLLPIGGLASLERMPEDPRQEFWITLAGPLVNLVIAAVAFGILALGGLASFTTDIELDLATWTNFLIFLFTANLGLFLFNLIPAFPMDGGRILRSLLSLWIPRDRATRFAAIVGRILAVGFIIYGLFGGAPFTAVIGLFIFMAAGSEARQVQQKADLMALQVRDRMRHEPVILPSTASAQDAWNALTLIDQPAVLVMDQGLYRGLVLKQDLRGAIASGAGGINIAGIARHVPSTTPSEPAIVVYQRMLAEQQEAMVVVDGGFRGVLLRTDLEQAFGPFTPRTA